MSRQDNIKRLIVTYEQHLQKLKEQRASLGVYTPAHILTEIENIEAEIEKLKTELETAQDSEIDEEAQTVPPDLAADSSPSTPTAGVPGKSPKTLPPEKKPIAKRYHLRNIRALLTEGFTLEELRRLCYDADEFRPVYEELPEHISKTKLIDKIIDHAYRRLQLDTLLALAQAYNPARYDIHQPYYEPTSSTVRILLVDDNQSWREQLGGLLQDYGYQVVTVVSKAEAIQRITDDEPYSLAIIDMRLDEEDEDNREGVDLGFWLRDNGYDLPVIIMTAYDMEAEIAKNITLRPFQFVAVEKGKIGSGGFADLLRQVELAIH